MGSNIKENGVPNAEKEVEIYERADMKGYYRIKDIYDEAYMAKIVGVKVFQRSLRSDLYHHRRAGSRKSMVPGTADWF